MNRFRRLFPVPRYMNGNCYSFDIAGDSLKYLGISWGEPYPRIFEWGSAPIPDGLLINGVIQKASSLVQFIRQHIRPPRGAYAAVAIPEQSVYVTTYRLPVSDPKQIREAVELSLEERIPLSAKEAVFESTPLAPVGNETSVLVTATPRLQAEAFSSLLRDLSFVPALVSSESQALSVSVAAGTGTEMIVDVGSSRTLFVIVSDGQVRFSSVSPVGGRMITESMMRGLSLSREDAEAKKHLVGISRRSADVPVRDVVVPGVSSIRDEIARHIAYWKTHNDSPSNASGGVDRIVVTGGQSLLRGFPEYLAAGLSIPVRIAESWMHIPSSGPVLPMVFDESLSYGVCLGLALELARNLHGYSATPDA